MVAKEPDWAPPKRRMSLVAGGSSGHTKPNSHGDQQPYDELGRYAGPGEGAWSKKPKEETARGGSLLTTLLGRDGDDFLAGGAGRDVLSLDGEYRAEAQGPDESRYRAKARLEDMLELPNWPSRDDLPELPQRGNTPPATAVGNTTLNRNGDPRDMFPKTKNVRDANLAPRITSQYEAIGRIFQENGAEVVITSANDSVHMPNSLHYKNLAIDIRGNEKSPETMIIIRDQLQKTLGKDYDVLYETYEDKRLNHIHIEYDPKRK